MIPEQVVPTELDDLLGEPEEDFDWVVEGLLEAQDRVILTGLEGRGKSMLLRQLAVQLGSGIHPFTHEAIDAQMVLFVDTENSRRQTRRKLTAIRAAAGEQYPKGEADGGGTFFKFRPEGLNLSSDEGLGWLAEVVASVLPDVLIIGPLYKLMGGDPTKEEVALDVAAAIDAIRAQYDVAVIIEAHSPYASGARSKREIRPYGASLWSRWPEFGIHLAPDGAIEHWRGPRDERAWPTRLERGNPWPWMPVADLGSVEPWNGPANCMKAVKELLDDHPTVDYSGNQLISTMRALGHMFRDKTVREAAERLAFNGDIKVRTGPRGSRLYSSAAQTEIIHEDF